MVLVRHPEVHAFQVDSRDVDKFFGSKGLCPQFPTPSPEQFASVCI